MAAGYYTYTTSAAFLEALAEAGVGCVFAGLGSPHETVALSAAHACAAVTRRPQTVLVHVDSGTQNLGAR